MTLKGEDLANPSLLTRPLELDWMPFISKNQINSKLGL